MELDQSPVFSSSQVTNRSQVETRYRDEEFIDQPESATANLGPINSKQPLSTIEEDESFSSRTDRFPENFSAMHPSQHQPTRATGKADPEVNPLRDSLLEDLRPLGLPLTLSVRSPGSFDPVKLRLLSLQSAFVFLKDPSQIDTRARYEALLQLGINAIGKPKEIMNRHLSRSERICFKKELLMLDTLLTEVFQYTSPDGLLAYSIKYQHLEDLQELLKHARDTIAKKALITPNTLPDIPTWGQENKPLQYWETLDFEILGTNFRLQVENFLAYIADWLMEEDGDETREEKGKQKESPRVYSSWINPPAGSSTPIRPLTGPTPTPFKAQAPIPGVQLPKLKESVASNSAR
ncbi:hypothetical protein EST38_g11835 [Candolleomyces aberdarensis]|uniref:Uncharacterized protein n=1 Tax=Candolleomyces aberdarensis TaxID=2316362 RepID=A0A4Q2D4L3_9AGAR|nr:hypothetical protein EST38_g11835 [Candolleomyces aberdarensis]